MNKFEEAKAWIKEGWSRVMSFTLERDEDGSLSISSSILGNGGIYAVGLDQAQGYFCGCLGNLGSKKPCSHILYLALLLKKSGIMSSLELALLLGEDWLQINGVE
jgi:hypothetical protein